MHAYRILLPSETDCSRFNSREKHMLTDSVQPYNKPIIDLACLVCTVKYQTSVFLHTKKPRSDISQYRPHARSVAVIINQLVLLCDIHSKFIFCFVPDIVYRLGAINLYHLIFILTPNVVRI